MIVVCVCVFSSNWVLWFAALPFNVGIIDSGSTCYCSCNGRFTCKCDSFGLSTLDNDDCKCNFNFLISTFFWDYRRRLQMLYRLYFLSLESLHCCILRLGRGFLWFKVLPLSFWLRLWL